MKPDILSESIFLLLHVHLTPPLRGRVPSEYCYNVWYEKIRIVSLTEGEKMKICLFVLTEWMYERDRHTGRQTDRHRMTAKAALA